MAGMLWHPLPGRLQSVSVANKSNIWGVTLDLQLAKFNAKTQQWQLVSVTTEAANQNRYSSTSSHSGTSTTTSSSSSLPSIPSKAQKTIAALLPAAFGGGIGSSSTTTTATNASSSAINTISNSSNNKHNINNDKTKTIDTFPTTLTDDENADSTIQVSAATDGTVVRLDGALKAWYLIAPHDNVDFEKDVIWIELGHFWKCVSVASISQIWGLSDCGDIYYGTSDRFVQLESAVTSGAGYGQPSFTHIAVGQDGLVLATDAHTGTVFKLKTHPTASHPPIWTALSGTGRQGLFMASCTLSTADFVVGVAADGHCYRFSNNRWTALGGGAKLDNIGVGADGYVVGVDRDGDLFGCQLESNNIILPKKIPNHDDMANGDLQGRDRDEFGAMQVPRTPTQQKTFARRPMQSPRELFEMAVREKDNAKFASEVSGMDPA
ncbi:hypothetical protein BGZ94_002801, partial [Podila epigama]